MKHHETSSAKRQLARFDELWNATISNYSDQNVPIVKNDNLCWSILFQPSPAIWQASGLPALTSQMEAECPGHRYYSPDKMHITLMGLAHKELWQHQSEALKRVLDDACQRHKAIQLRLFGLNVLSDTVVAQVVDPEDQLLSFATDLIESCKMLDATLGLAVGLHQELWWVTLARLNQSVADDCISFVARKRHDDFGCVEVDGISLVETTRNFDLSQTRTILKIKLGG